MEQRPGAPRLADNDRIAQLRQAVERIGPLRPIDVWLPHRDVTFRLLQPTDLDALIEAVIGDPEENLPHWAELWPSGIALADEILSHPGLVRGRRCFELGCGLGTSAIAASRSGAQLIAADYAPEALALTVYHCAVNAGLEPDTRRLNWRRPDDELFELVSDGFPVVLAADVLYETRDIYPLVALVERLVASGGLLWLAEPGRGVARRFVEILAERGWRQQLTTHDGPWPDPRDQDAIVNVFRLTPPRE